MPPKLNVPAMTHNVLENYNLHVDHFINFLHKRLDCRLVYTGPLDVSKHIKQRTTYACSVQSNMSPNKLFRDVFPVMIGSRLDIAIRYKQLGSFEKGVPDLLKDARMPFSEMDIGRGFFIVTGNLKHVPYFYVNDPTNTHLVSHKMVRVYTYDDCDRGKELSYYTTDTDTKKRGDLVVVLNDGSESTDAVYEFFDFCPYPTDPAVYMTQLYREARFDIDHLSNKVIVSPGHLFVKLFIKYLYVPLRDRDWKMVKLKLSLVTKSIETGTLLHVLPRKTLYHKENRSTGKMTTVPQESHREIGANGEVFVEKNSTCYREVNMQTYPLNPYVLQMVVQQISNKVKPGSIDAYHESWVGFFCLVGCFDTKNVGRATMMVRDTIVSKCDDLDPVYHDARRARIWDLLHLDACRRSSYHVIVNEACIPVTQKCFNALDLKLLKRELVHVECFRRAHFVYVRYKTGLMFKKLPGTDVWITKRDEVYWAQQLLGTDDMNMLLDRFGYDYITSYFVDLNTSFKHNSFCKNIATFNSLKNAVLAVNKMYALFFMDTLSAYVKRLTPYHQRVLEPENDGISPHFSLWVPRVTVAYMSFLGSNQEDCIVRRADVNAFHCCRFYTVRSKILADGPLAFHPARGDPNEKDLLGTIVNHGTYEMDIELYSMHVTIVKVTPCVFHLLFSKSPFRVVQYVLSGHVLSISVEQDHPTETGDKLSSFHGQKGVMLTVDRVPLLDECVQPDLIVNTFSLYRMTPGQIIEGIQSGTCKDATTIRNSDGTLLTDKSKVLYASTFYFPIAYWSSEHLYAPDQCVLDKVLNQAVKGRSRGGGMRIGNMEYSNGLKGNGLGACCQEKFFEHGDLVPSDTDPTIALPKAVALVCEDSKFYKANITIETRPSVVEISKRPRHMDHMDGPSTSERMEQ